jgi:hypothetical protein
MGQNITEPGNTPPRDRRVTQSHIGRDLFGGFAEKFQVAENRIDDQLICKELLLTQPFRVATHFGAEAPHVLKKQRPVPRAALLRQGKPPRAQSARGAQHEDRYGSPGRRGR